MAFSDFMFPLVAYISGAIPFGLIIARCKGIDLRRVGSGNIGATNTARSIGKTWGIITLILDAIKGFAPVLAAKLTLGSSPESDRIVAISMLAAVLGHMFTIFLKFKGGKGVATTLGVALAIAPWAGLVGGVSYVAVYAAFRISSLGSFALTLSLCLMMAFLKTPWPSLLAMGVIAVLIIIKHIPNILRLIRGEEQKV